MENSFVEDFASTVADTGGANPAILAMEFGPPLTKIILYAITLLVKSELLFSLWNFSLESLVDAIINL